MQVSEETPLQECRHYVAAAREAFGPGATEIEQFYAGLGRGVLGTIADGDCGIDVMGQMLETQANDLAFRNHLRAMLADALLEHANDMFWQHAIALTEGWAWVRFFLSSLIVLLR